MNIRPVNIDMTGISKACSTDFQHIVQSRHCHVGVSLRARIVRRQPPEDIQ
jgi:hypothetical protein